MAILKELFSTLNEKKVGDDQYFVTVGSGKKLDLFTERSFPSFEAARKFVRSTLSALQNDRDSDTDAADDEAEQLENAEIMSGAQLKKSYPKLFEAVRAGYQSTVGAEREKADPWADDEKEGDDKKVIVRPKTQGQRDRLAATIKSARTNARDVNNRHKKPTLGSKSARDDSEMYTGRKTAAVTDKNVHWHGGADRAAGRGVHEAKDEDGNRTYETYAAWKRAAVKLAKMSDAEADVWFDGDEDICQAMVGAKPFKKGSTQSFGEWDGSSGLLYKSKSLSEALNKKKEGELLFLVKSRKKKQEVKVYAKDKAQALDRVAVHDGNGWFTGPDVTAMIIKEARSIPGWFQDGAKVKLMPEYADKDPNEVFTLKSVDTETGKGRISDDQGKGWGISYYQVYPKNKTPAIHESAEKLTADKAEKEGHTWLVNFTHCPGESDTRDYTIRAVKAITSAQAVAIATKKLPEQHRDCAKVASVKMTDEAVKEAEGNMTFTKKDDGKEGKYGVKVGQVYVPADGSKNELKVLSINHASEDALVFDKAQNKERHIDLFKLAKVRYSLKEDAALQGLGKTLSGKAPAAPSDGVDVPMDGATTDTAAAAPPSDTEVKGDADDQQTPAEFKVGDVVKTLVGPHKGEEHDVTKVYPDGRMDLKPKGLEGSAVKYRNGGVTAKPDQVVLAESIVRGTKSLLRTIVIDLTEAAAKDGMMPLSYRPAKGHKIEAYGRKGMKNTMWRKFFKDSDAMSKWCEDNDATVEGSRDLDKDELK